MPLPNRTRLFLRIRPNPRILLLHVFVTFYSLNYPRPVPGLPLVLPISLSSFFLSILFFSAWSTRKSAEREISAQIPRRRQDLNPAEIQYSAREIQLRQPTPPFAHCIKCAPAHEGSLSLQPSSCSQSHPKIQKNSVKFRFLNFFYWRLGWGRSSPEYY